jgi:TonB-dependent SusC/RagA subfamily outer membrane receptor
MDNQDKIFDKFKKAAENSEQKDFPGMDKVWARVEEKLDKKEDKKAISLWKKIAIAASVLLLISIGSQLIKSDKIVNNPKVVINENETIQESITKNNDAVVASDSPIVPKAEAAKILDQQIKQPQSIAIKEARAPIYYEPAITQAASAPIATEAIVAAPIHEEYSNEEENFTTKDKASLGYSKTIERESAKMAYADKQSQMTKKGAPLIVLNGNAISHSNDEKRDKMMQNQLPNLQPENVDSLVILDAPLYIIDGVYYSENDLFGINPTSPYAPLNKQEIKSITVLQDLEATSKYGEKGKKGVVIITTKTGKPTSKK